MNKAKRDTTIRDKTRHGMAWHSMAIGTRYRLVHRKLPPVSATFTHVLVCSVLRTYVNCVAHHTPYSKRNQTRQSSLSQVRQARQVGRQEYILSDSRCQSDNHPLPVLLLVRICYQGLRMLKIVRREISITTLITPKQATQVSSYGKETDCLV